MKTTKRTKKETEKTREWYLVGGEFPVKGPMTKQEAEAEKLFRSARNINTGTLVHVSAMRE